MDHNNEDLEQTQLVERIFLYKNQIIELHDRHFRLSRRMYYTYKYFTQSFKIYQLSDVIGASIELLQQIAPHRRLNPFLASLSDFASMVKWVWDYNSGWLKQPFYVYSLYLQLATVFDYIVSLLDLDEFPDQETVNSIYWELSIVFGRTHEEYEKVAHLQDHPLHDIEKVPFPPSQKNNGSKNTKFPSDRRENP